jgi:hypothetical protein
MKKTIFNCYVAMDSQETCDRMKAVCLDNGLPIRKHSMAFDFTQLDVFRFSKAFQEFGIWYKIIDFTQVTETEFLELLKEYKNDTQIHD